MNALVLLMAVIISAPTLLDHTPVTATQDIDLLLMEESVSLFRLHYNYEPIMVLGYHISTIFLSTGYDIDECTGPSICHQVCTNIEGSFTCGCEAGYVLDSDRASCSGIIINIPFIAA